MGLRAAEQNKKKYKNLGGRPSVMTVDKLQKLELAFSAGCTDREACLFAGIAMQTLYNYQAKNPDFAERKELLKESPKLKARFNIVKELELNNADISKWYLERKAKDEFSLKNEANINVTMEGLNDKEKALSDYMKGFLNMPE